MAYANFYDYRWRETNETNNQISFSNAFNEGISFHKSRNGFHCYVCDKEHPKGTRYLGLSYEHICMYCAKEWFKNSKQVLDELKIRMEKAKEVMDKNIDTWKDEALIGAI